uniref:AT1G65230-like protein n=1 Tax=Rhizophora mucronata TaxID=61149 RepID=A0A2P2K0D9_RHIMU
MAWTLESCATSSSASVAPWSNLPPGNLPGISYNYAKAIALWKPLLFPSDIRYLFLLLVELSGTITYVRTIKYTSSSYHLTDIL